MGIIGFALTNVAIYNALDARGRDAPGYEIQDRCSGHPQRTGQYHYHDYSPCVTDRGGQPGGHSSLVGYALDGFGIFGPRDVNGKIVTNADLDACHGHTHEIVWDGKRTKMYHYHYTYQYPYSDGCYRGKVDSALLSRGGPDGPPQAGLPGGGPNGGPRGGPGGGPRGGQGGGLAAAAAELGVSVDALRRAVGPPPPDFAAAARKLGISERRIRDAMVRNGPNARR
jgi:hypothetical protein